MIELNHENFNEIVLKSKGPFLVNFWSPSCSACLNTDKVLNLIEDKLNGKVHFGNLNILQNPGIAQEYSIPATPTLIIFKNGQAVERAIGMRSEKVLLEKLKSLI